mmetsp:Transcript_22021/g.16388  ORF Transcript_22021/g.16388 Transcript_22021/m.16388 type:complete len:114 (+) Transcript_22021:630-971(+)
MRHSMGGIIEEDKEEEKMVSIDVDEDQVKIAESALRSHRNDFSSVGHHYPDQRSLDYDEEVKQIVASSVLNKENEKIVKRRYRENLSPNDADMNFKEVSENELRDFDRSALND